MGSLAFIGDVIYGLKMDMGMPMTIGKKTVTRNITTGARTETFVTKYVQNGIYLPLNTRIQFLKSVGVHRVNALEQGNREILLDASDIEAGFLEDANTGGYIEINGNRGDVVSVEDYTNAFIVIVKQIKGMP